jgi:hypothetical protein
VLASARETKTCRAAAHPASLRRAPPPIHIIIIITALVRPSSTWLYNISPVSPDAFFPLTSQCIDPRLPTAYTSSPPYHFKPHTHNIQHNHRSTASPQPAPAAMPTTTTASTSLLTSPSPYHITTYGLLMGSQVFHSFVAGPLSFSALPRPQFAVLQATIFPVYFGVQTLLPALLALSYPAKPAYLSATGSLAGERQSLLHAGSRAELYAMLAIGLMGLANWAVVGPATTRVMRERKGQEVRDGKKSYDKGPHSEAMRALNSRFGRLHGVSSLVNLGAVLATGYYGVLLASRLQ